MNFLFWSLLTKTKYLNETNQTEVKAQMAESNLEDDLMLFLIPVFCIFGLITNTLNVLVFMSPKMKDVSFKYMLAISVSNLLYNAISIYNYVVYCENCKLTNAYATSIYKIFVNNYMVNCLSLFSLFIELNLSFQRYFILTNMQNTYLVKTQNVLLTCMIVSLICYIPALFCYDIETVKVFSRNKTLIRQTYKTVLSDFGVSLPGKGVTIALLALRILMGSVFLAFINIYNTYLFRKRFYNRAMVKEKHRKSLILHNQNARQKSISKKQQAYIELKVSRNMTLMVIWTCVLYVIGSSPRYIYIIIKYILEASKRYRLISLITFLILLFSNGLPFFIYYFYNNIFRKIIRDSVRKMLCFCFKSDEMPSCEKNLASNSKKVREDSNATEFI